MHLISQAQGGGKERREVRSNSLPLLAETLVVSGRTGVGDGGCREKTGLEDGLAAAGRGAGCSRDGGRACGGGGCEGVREGQEEDGEERGVHLCFCFLLERWVLL